MVPQPTKTISHRRVSKSGPPAKTTIFGGVKTLASSGLETWSPTFKIVNNIAIENSSHFWARSKNRQKFRSSQKSRKSKKSKESKNVQKPTNVQSYEISKFARPGRPAQTYRLNVVGHVLFASPLRAPRRLSVQASAQRRLTCRGIHETAPNNAS